MTRFSLKALYLMEATSIVVSPKRETRNSSISHAAQRKRSSSFCIFVLAVGFRCAVLLSESQYTCGYKSSSSVWILLRPFITGVFVVLPTVIVVTTSVQLVKHLMYARRVAHRARGNLRWQGIATVVLTATVYCFSFFPKGVHMIIRPYVQSNSYQVIASRVTETLMYFNVAANFFVYSLTVPSFRLFLKTRIKQITLSGNDESTDRNQRLLTAFIYRISVVIKR